LRNGESHSKKYISPADIYYGRNKKIISIREHVKHKTLKLRKVQNLGKNFMKKSFDKIKSIP